VGFQSGVVPDKYRILFALNPMVGIIDGFRHCLLGTAIRSYWPEVAIASVSTTLILISGIWYFRRTERTFADVI
jgi:lipopolysaccharide transport system permease protein